MKIYIDDRSNDPLDFCNTCHSLFCDGDPAIEGDPSCFHQTLKDQSFLSTKAHGQVVQECCEYCAQEAVDGAGYSYR